MSVCRNEAQILAFSPLIFQAIKTMTDLKIFEYLHNIGKAGLNEMENALNLNNYVLTVLMDIAVYAHLVNVNDGKYKLTGTGRCFCQDDTTIINMNFVNDVCYKGAFYLTESLKKGKPCGLKVFGDWDTIYEGLSKLPAYAQKSWFNFDNYYSDASFEAAVTILLKNNPVMVYDLGANTGKFGKVLLRMSQTAELTCFDLPEQLELAQKNIGENPRTSFQTVDILIDDLPSGADAIWMSQFLDCFSPERIVFILKKAANALNRGGKVYILEPFIDKQRSNPAALALSATSLYFVCMANGYSKIYKQSEFELFIDSAGLLLTEAHQKIGDYDYTLLECMRK
jgi:SAM-dependent methyltransferase